MKIYTKSGDQGETGLYGGARIAKDDLRIHAYGTVDELNATVGWAVTRLGSEQVHFQALRATLVRVQSDLFFLGAELATPAAASGKKPAFRLLEDRDVENLEREIDAMESELSKLMHFILPGGSEAAAALHVARTVCRRAERAVVTLSKAESVRGESLRYLNRLADHLFVCARHANHRLGVKDVPWVP